MVTLSRLNGSVVAINPDLITWIDVTPDTTVSLLGGDKIIVRESLDEVIDRVIAFRRSVGAPYTGGKDGAIAYLDAHRNEGGYSSRRTPARTTPPSPSRTTPPSPSRTVPPFPRGSIPPEGT